MATKNINKENFAENFSSFPTIILKGLGQIMIQENSVTGLFFLIGIFYGSITMGVAALVATICGTATAIILKYDTAEINKGYYGFSAALVGVSLLLFLKPVLLTWIFVIIGSSLASIIQQFFIKRKIPVFTLPFVLVTWTILLFTRMFFTDALSIMSSGTSVTIDYFLLGFKSFGQVIFQDNFISGLLFFIAVFINSPISTLYGFAGAILSAFIAFKFSLPINEIGNGLFSYNAVLCAIVFGNKKPKESIWVLLSVLLSLFVSILMTTLNIAPLTFPFVLASCFILFLKVKHKSNIKLQI